MEPFSNSCNICLSTTNSLTDTSESKVSLHTLIPELEVLEDISICQDCSEKLDEFIRFKALCLDALTRWKLKKTATTQENYPADTSLECKNVLDDPTDPTEDKPVSDDEYDQKESPDDNLFSCEFCKNFYLTKKNLQAHQNYCKQQNLHTTVISTNNKKLQRHKVYRLSCEVCNEQFQDFEDLKLHYSSEHGLSKDFKPYVCVRCNDRFASLPPLQDHLKTHHTSKICSKCGKSFSTRNDLMVHMYTHYNRRNYICKDCNKSFNTNKNLRTHILVVHTDRSLWKHHCVRCDKRFPLKSNYDQHCRRHTGEKMFPCHICDKSFVSNSDLKRHIRVHSNIKLYRCEPCDREYKTQSSYKNHNNRKHSKTEVKAKEKLFVCHVCPSRFRYKSKLLRHLCMHSGLKPFKCDLCEKQFVDKYCLGQHLKGVHHVDNEK